MIANLPIRRRDNYRPDRFCKNLMKAQQLVLIGLHGDGVRRG